MSEPTLFEWIVIPFLIVFIPWWAWFMHKRFWKNIRDIDEETRRTIKKLEASDEETIKTQSDKSTS